MQVSISARHGQLSEPTREKVAAKFEKLTRIFERLTAISVTVDLQNKEVLVVEALVSAEHKHDFVARETHSDVLAGVDLALAYGSEVKAYGSGVVTAAGDRPGYGLTVVVDHGGGRETLYAHLSSLDVQPGDAVTAGQRIARSGNSGRATGAHLHFEAREFGRPVDVAGLEAGWAGRAVDTGVGKPDEIASGH